MNGRPGAIAVLRDAALDLDVAANMSSSSMAVAECRTNAIARRAGDLRQLHDRMLALQSESSVIRVMHNKWLLLGMSEEQMRQRARELRSDLAALGLSVDSIAAGEG